MTSILSMHFIFAADINTMMLLCFAQYTDKKIDDKIDYNCMVKKL